MDESYSPEDKLKVILNGFLNKNYQTTNDIYFEMLITHLSGKGGKDFSILLHSTFVHEWIDKCLTLLVEDYSQLNDKVITFMLRLIILLTENEWLIAQVRDRQFGDRIQNIVVGNIGKLTASVKLGYVRFIAAISANGLGLGWVKRNEAWNILIGFCTENNTVYVIREAMAVIYELLYKFSVKTNDEELCIRMLEIILNPILDNLFSENAPDVRVNDVELQNKIAPRLELIGFILEKTLESESKTKIVSYCEVNFQLERNLWKLADMTHNNQALSKIVKVMTSLNYAKLIYEKWINGKIPPEDFNKFGVNFFNHMNFSVLRRGCANVLTIAEHNFTLWKKLGSRAPTQILIENENIEFENQLILFHLLPVIFILRPTRQEYDEVLEPYIMKLFAISSDYTVRIEYAYREVLLDCPQNACDLALKSIHGILAMEHILSKNRAILVFQAMMYALKEFTVDSKEANTSFKVHPISSLLLQSPNVLRSILICLHTLVKSYRITWKDSIETICLLNIVLDLLKDPNLVPRVAVQSLKLAQLSIEHYLSPNLALLMDNFSESGMQDLGPMMMKRLHDNSWEVRDSTLELITSIVEISNMKFPGFQQYILDSGICPVIFSMAKNDDEPYIRASAFKCLTQMTMINLIWEKGLSEFDMLSYLLTSINEETEGIVRMEAVQLITKIFDHRKISSDNLESLYLIMRSCAVNDLHWEVKTYALHFWSCLICHQFGNQGMIDGTFPTVTFSKELKKIVTLTEKEILLRIKKILNDLSELGCLNVLMECLHDDCDLEVVKIAVLIVKKLIDCLNRYDFMKSIEIETDSSENNEQNNDKIVGDQNRFCEDQGTCSMEVNGETGELIDRDKIIESIVTANDLNLLAKNFENNLIDGQKSCGKEAMIVDDVNEFHKKNIDKIKPNDFVRLVCKMNLDSLVEMKKDWITSTESFESLLDDMIYSIKEVDVNDADCY